MPMGPPMMSSTYHSGCRWLGDITIPRESQLCATGAGLFPLTGLTVKQVSDALAAKAPVRTTGREAFSISAADLSNYPAPATSMTNARPLMTEATAVSHFSLSPLEREPLGK
jgi:hypothetical protein